MRGRGSYNRLLHWLNLVRGWSSHPTSTEWIKDLDWTLVKVVRRLFLCQFGTLLKWAAIFWMIINVVLALSIQLYIIYQGFRISLGKSSKMIIFVSLLNIFKMSHIVWGGLVICWNWLKPKTKPLYPNYACSNPWYTWQLSLNKDKR